MVSEVDYTFYTQFAFRSHQKFGVMVFFCTHPSLVVVVDLRLCLHMCLHVCKRKGLFSFGGKNWLHHFSILFWCYDKVVKINRFLPLQLKINRFFFISTMIKTNPKYVGYICLRLIAPIPIYIVVTQNRARPIFACRFQLSISCKMDVWKLQFHRKFIVGRAIASLLQHNNHSTLSLHS